MSAERRYISTTRVTLGATTADTLYVDVPYAGEWSLLSARMLGHDALAANGSNNRTVTLKKGATSLGNLSTSATGIVAGEARAFTLTGDRDFTGEQVDSDTEPLSIAVTHAGTGGALDVDVVCVWEPVR